MNIIFIGTPKFAIPTLQALINEPAFNVVLVITQPDKPVGRKQLLTQSPVKQLAQKNNITVIQPEKIKNTQDLIRSQAPDLIVVAAYAQLIPQSILDIPKHGCINVHGSLLPKYRGSSCVQAAILNGDQESGVTIMQMEAGLDTGPILAQLNTKIDSAWTSEELYEKISLLGGELIVDTIKNFTQGNIKPVIQDNTKASLVKNIKKEDGEINANSSAQVVERFIRAMHSWPGAYISAGDLKVKIIEVSKDILDINCNKPGQLFEYNKQLVIQCNPKALIISKIQPAGKKPMTGKEFINGYKDYIMASSSNG